MMFRPLLIVLLLFLTSAGSSARTPVDSRLQPYLEVIRDSGRPPLPFVLDLLDRFDLILFDDAWHPAAEPFIFYQQLMRTPAFQQQVKHIFLEVVPINRQPCLDAYLASDPEDISLLFPAFQDDFSGTGWPLKSYFDLLHTLYQVNRQLPAEDRLRAVAVNHPVYWSEITDSADLALFRKSLSGNDYLMYKRILDDLQAFRSDHKGIFLTNTRHAYKGIKDRYGNFFWNCGTFFHQWHPGKTVSLRFHNMILHIEGEKPRNEQGVATTTGMEQYRYRWARMADGLWDSAFQANGNIPVAIPLEGNVFGETPYLGNHMHKAASDQTMVDANDAIIFLAPLEALHNSAKISHIYTADFKRELARRLAILYGEDQLREEIRKAGIADLPALIDTWYVDQPETLIPQAAGLPAIDAWKKAPY